MTDKPDARSDSTDLARRLARYRSRVEREGRKSGVAKLDRAIEQARRPA